MTCVSIDEVCKDISSIRYDKSDGLRGTDYYHYICASHKFKVLVSIMIQSVVVHGHTPEDLLESVLRSIPKNEVIYVLVTHIRVLFCVVPYAKLYMSSSLSCTGTS